MRTITRDRALLGALQLSDSALPIGRFVHSHGLEAWSRDHPRPGAGELAELIEASVCESFATLDGAVLAHAHRARAIESLLSLDRALIARKLSPSARNASQACGRRLAALAPQLAPTDRLVGELAELVRSGETDGNLAVVHGALARALGLSTREAVLVELRGAAATLLSAAVRLAIVAPTRAQVILAELAPALADAAARALKTELEELSATSPELELYSLVHARRDGRMFQT